MNAPWYMVPLFVLLSSLMVYVPLMFAVATFGGWGDLAKDHPPSKPKLGAKRGVARVMTSAWVRYPSVVLYAIDDEHLHLRLPIAVGIFHRPMSIPWGEMETLLPSGTQPGMMIATIGDDVLVLPAALVRRELELREALEHRAVS
ncbi:MAG: hypothetical protein AAGD00_02625 [Planctomycetota bacterium]